MVKRLRKINADRNMMRFIILKEFLLFKMYVHCSNAVWISEYCEYLRKRNSQNKAQLVGVWC